MIENRTRIQPASPGLPASAGARLRLALRAERPLQIVGTINAYIAMLAERAGFRAIYLSGAGVANSSYGLPDLGMTTLDNVLEDVRRITGASALPLLADADTGFGPAFMIARSVREFIKAGAAGIHIEDQVAAKRCGHRPGKAIVSKSEMVDRIKAAVDARTDADFVIMARTDALAVEGLEAALERAEAYRAAGADMLFPEALTALEQYRAFRQAVDIPILANMTEFGKTPLFDLPELAKAGVDMVLYPLTLNRIMNQAAVKALETLREDGHQMGLVGRMQTREELYKVLGYHAYEAKLDALFGRSEADGEDGEGDPGRTKGKSPIAKSKVKSKTNSKADSKVKTKLKAKTKPEKTVLPAKGRRKSNSRKGG
ncbi:MAG: 2-methylisocitrate lyase [Fibrobacteres bacterium]|nr:2-methylisocitrate lyase [Fibrobacterota bacterium]